MSFLVILLSSAGKIDGTGLPGGLIIYQGHLFPLKGHLCAEGFFERLLGRGLGGGRLFGFLRGLGACRKLGQGSFFLENLRKPRENGQILERTMVEKNGESRKPPVGWCILGSVRSR